MEIAREVRVIWLEDKPLFVRVSAVDGSREGWTNGDSVAIARERKIIGIDVIDNSSGGLGVFDYPSDEGFQVPIAAQVRAKADVKTMAVGLILDPHQAEAIVANGEADLVVIRHVTLNNPNFAFHAQQILIAIASDAPFSNWEPQLGWWLDNRVKRLARLGPLASRKAA